MILPYDKIKAGRYQCQKVEVEVKPEAGPDQGLHQAQHHAVHKSTVKVLVQGLKHISYCVHVRKQVECVCGFTNKEDDLVDIINDSWDSDNLDWPAKTPPVFFIWSGAGSEWPEEYGVETKWDLENIYQLEYTQQYTLTNEESPIKATSEVSII